jgi:DNA-binding NarL/FixJ family response regulator
MESRQPPAQPGHLSAAIISDDRLFCDVLTAAMRQRQITMQAPEPEQWTQIPERTVVVLDAKDSARDDLSDTVRRIVNAAAGARVLLLSREPRRGLSTLARNVGAVGWVTRRDSLDDFARSVIGAAEGEPVGRQGQHQPQSRPTVKTPALTTREMQVLELVASGSSDVLVAEELRISVHTVRSHLQSARNKLGVGTRFEAVASIRGWDLVGGSTPPAPAAPPAWRRPGND